jgi:catechol 2,3-dioxygenase-like lactoylglutathione lyase family enzyme
MSFRRPASFLGIDHPLILVRELDRARDTYRRLGFTPTPVGKHPWGTSNSLLMLEDSLLELMSVYDESLIDERPVGGFAFGRYQRDRLAEREGMSLVAVHSKDSQADRAMVESRGAVCQGQVDFRRAVTLPDGTQDEAVVTLQILYDPALPRVSHFICHQHKPHYVWVPDWMAHDNTAFAFASVTYAAKDPAIAADRLAHIYGLDAVTAVDGGFAIQTGKGTFYALTPDYLRARYVNPPADVLAEDKPAGMAVAIRVRSLGAATAILDREGIAYRRHNLAGAPTAELLDTAALGNIVVELVES